MDPTLDLEFTRILPAPRAEVWRAWTEADELRQWFLPAPMVLRVDRLEVHPSGGLVTSLSEDGRTFHPHIDAVFLVVEEDTRLVWTNAIGSAWRPQRPQPVPLTTEILLLPHPEGTDYRVVVRHGCPDDRDRHVELGFFEGWETVTDQLDGHLKRRT